MIAKAFITALGFVVLACSAAPEGAADAKLCAPGAQVQCACPKGAHGIQACRPDGAGFTKCDCAGGFAGGNSGGVSNGGGTAGDPGAGGEVNAGGNGGEPASGGSGGAENGGSGAGWNGSGGWAGGSAGPVGDYAGGVSISEVAIYQAVKVSLAQNGSEVTQRNAPVVEGRPALVRVSVKPSAGFSGRPLAALLELKSANPKVSSQTATLTVNGASNDLDLGSTFNFTLPPEQVTADLTLKVSLHEPSGASVGTVESGAIVPAQGAITLGAQQSGAIRVTIVPFRYMADGSGRLPDTSEQQMKAYHDILFAMYPTTEVILALHAPVDYSGQIGPEWGWSEWLDTLCDVRIKDGGDSKIYYFGISAPTANWSQYGGGVAGLGNVPSADGDWGRCAVGLGFPGADPYGLIMAHEVGHTNGRPHAPCGVDGEPFPHPGAGIGVTGYNLISQKLKDPNVYTDVMGYCDPQWISDYNFGNLFKRIKWVNQNYLKTTELPRAYRKLLVDLDGSVKWGGRVSLTEKIEGAPTRVDLLAPDGSAIGSVEGTFSSFSEPPAGALFIPEPPPGVSAIAALGHSAIGLPK